MPYIVFKDQFVFKANDLLIMFDHNYIMLYNISSPMVNPFKPEFSMGIFITTTRKLLLQFWTL